MYLCSGAVEIIEKTPEKLLDPNLGIDWELMAQRYPKWVSIKDGAVVFDSNGAKDIVPSKLVGKLLTWDLTEEDMQFISSQVNGTSQFTIPNTPYDNLEYTRFSVSLAFFISEFICIFLTYFVL